MDFTTVAEHNDVPPTQQWTLRHDGKLKKNGGKRARNGNGLVSRTLCANDLRATVINVYRKLFIVNVFFLRILPNVRHAIERTAVAAAVAIVRRRTAEKKICRISKKKKFFEHAELLPLVVKYRNKNSEHSFTTTVAGYLFYFAKRVLRTASTVAAAVTYYNGWRTM